MPGTSVSHMIWFIAAITVAVAVVSVLTTSVLELSDGLEERTDALSGEMRADIEIVNDPAAVPYEPGTSTLHVYLKNTGSTILDTSADSILLFVNGTGTPAGNVTVLGSGAQWAPGVTVEAEFTVSGLSEGVVYSMKVTASRYEGVDDTLEFRINDV